MGAQLALPAGAFFKLEMIPQFDKNSIPNLSILLGCLIITKRPLRVFARFGLAEVLIFMFLVGPIVTSQLNGDPAIIGGQIRPGVGLYDALSYVENSFIFIVPFFIARQFLAKREHLVEVLCVSALAGLIYSIPMLFEIRMAPTLQFQIYGFSPSSFAMVARGGGYRPYVFMENGLIASFFIMTTAVAATALWRARISLFRGPPSIPAAYLTIILVLCKSFGALLYGMMIIPLTIWTRPRIQMRVAVLLLGVALLYPALRTFGVFPTEYLLDAVSSVSDERKRSLDFRFINEDKLLNRAWERPVFGWGRYGRNRVYEEDGRDETVTDGFWIITIGQYGIFGFIAQFGLLSIGILRAAASLRFVKLKQEAVLLSALALIGVVNVVELIPNATLLPWTWLVCGLLLGRAEALERERYKARDNGLQIVEPQKMRIA